MLQPLWVRLLILQVLLGIPIVVVPVVVSGIVSLAATIPLYICLIVVIQATDLMQRRRSGRAPLIGRLRTVMSHFSQLTRDSHTFSVWAILRDLLGDAAFRAQMEYSGNRQAGDLLVDRSQRLFNEAGYLSSRIGRLVEGSADSELIVAVGDFGRLFLEYRTLVDQLLRFLRETDAEGERVQNKPPYSTRIHHSLADDYDRLMNDVRELRNQLPEAMQVLEFDDQHLTLFRRALILTE